ECPPLEGDGDDGGSTGEPHIVTFDGAQYAFQMAGEFVLARASDGFEVQTRQEKLKDMDVSVNTAAAIRVGSHRIAFYAHDFNSVPTSVSRLYVDGKPARASDSGLKVGGATVTARGDNAYDVDLPNNRHINVDFYDWDGSKYFDFNIKISRSDSAKFM